MKHFLTTTLLALLSFGPFYGPQAAEHDYQVTTIAANLPEPWSLVFLPNGEMLVAGKRGDLLLVNPNGDTTQITTFDDVTSYGQGGLMDLTLHPQFATNGLVYYSYTAKNIQGQYGTVLARFRWDGQQVKDNEVLLRAANLGYARVHFGSRIVFDDQGFLFLGLGERGEPSQSQNLANHKGTILRLTADGKAPTDNPFGNRQDARAEIYSYGHRNPQGMIFENSKLWVHEHGPRGGDELNLVIKGANYGWPVISYGINYDGSKVGKGLTAKAGMEQPLVYWVPSIAPSGMIRYQGDLFPEWKGDFFIGALALRHLRRVIMRGDEVVGQEELLAGEARIREVAQDKQGYVYVLTDSNRGRLLRLEPK